MTRPQSAEVTGNVLSINFSTAEPATGSVGFQFSGIGPGLGRLGWFAPVFIADPQPAAVTAIVQKSAQDAQVALQTPPPYAAKTLNQSHAASHSTSGSSANVNLVVNVQYPTTQLPPSP